MGDAENITTEIIAELLAKAAPEGLKLADLERRLDVSRKRRPRFKSFQLRISARRRVLGGPRLPRLMGS